jgi:hypothetical protein
MKEGIQVSASRCNGESAVPTGVVALPQDSARPAVAPDAADLNLRDVMHTPYRHACADSAGFVASY